MKCTTSARFCTVILMQIWCTTSALCVTSNSSSSVPMLSINKSQVGGLHETRSGRFWRKYIRLMSMLSFTLVVLCQRISSRVVHSSYIKISKGYGVNVVEFSDQFFQIILTGVTALCPWARHINPCLVLVQPRKTLPDITMKLLTGTYRIKTNK